MAGPIVAPLFLWIFLISIALTDQCTAATLPRPDENEIALQRRQALPHQRDEWVFSTWAPSLFASHVAPRIGNGVRNRNPRIPLGNIVGSFMLHLNQMDYDQTYWVSPPEREGIPWDTVIELAFQATMDWQPRENTALSRYSLGGKAYDRIVAHDDLAGCYQYVAHSGAVARISWAVFSYKSWALQHRVIVDPRNRHISGRTDAMGGAFGLNERSREDLADLLPPPLPESP